MVQGFYDLHTPPGICTSEDSVALLHTPPGICTSEGSVTEAWDCPQTSANVLFAGTYGYWQQIKTTAECCNLQVSHS